VIEFADPEHLANVLSFAFRMGLGEQLFKKLIYLSNYACHPDSDEETEREPKRCILMADFAPHSFRFAMYRRNPELPRDHPTPWKFWLNGGLIFNGPECPNDGSAPAYTVSLHNEVGWFVHT
jgi:hypothetical protein